jgi:hypothetical protein
MILIPGGWYATAEEYRQKWGLSSVESVKKAASDGRIAGAIRFGDTTKIWLIPANAILINNRITTGKYVGMNRKKKQTIDALHKAGYATLHDAGLDDE